MKPQISLRPVVDADLPVFWQFQQDAEYMHVLGAGPDDPRDRQYFEKQWKSLRETESIWLQTVVADGEVAGYVLSFYRGDEGEVPREFGYAIGRPFWGRGIGYAASKLFLETISERPLIARCIHDNAGSIRILEKLGFQREGSKAFFFKARGQECEELMWRLS